MLDHDLDFGSDCFDNPHAISFDDLTNRIEGAADDEPTHKPARSVGRPRNDPDEYTSNERLFHLSAELEKLNFALLRLKMPDGQRLQIMRAFAAQSAAKRYKPFKEGPTKTRTPRLLPTGVSPSGKRFCAYISPSRDVNKYVGTFDTPEEAHEAFKKAHIELNGDKSRYFEEATA
jgi:hypothetical protein